MPGPRQRDPGDVVRQHMADEEVAELGAAEGAARRQVEAAAVGVVDEQRLAAARLDEHDLVEQRQRDEQVAGLVERQPVRRGRENLWHGELITPAVKLTILPRNAEAEPAWGEAVNGLRWRVWPRKDIVVRGQSVEIDCQFQNVSEKPLRIYMTVAPGQSLQVRWQRPGGIRDGY